MTLIFSSVAYFYFVGFHVFSVTSYDWMMQGDLRKYWSAWNYFRHEPFGWPITRIEGLVRPFGTSAVEMDIIPLLAIPFKYFQGDLPEKFQYFGLWLFVCYLLQGAMSWLLLRECKVDNWTRVPGSLLFVTASCFLYRFNHIALCSHFLILAGIWILIRAKNSGKNDLPVLGEAIILCAAATIHPYILCMCLGLAAALVIQQFSFTRLFFFKAAVIFGLPLLTLKFLGVFGFRSFAGGDFSGYQADLLTLFNSFGFSLVVPPLRHPWGGYEGQCYIGLSGFILLGFYFWKRKSINSQNVLLIHGAIKKWTALISVCIVMAVFALSAKVNFGGNEVINLEWLYKPLQPLPSIFRTTGRFVWPLFYLMLAYFISFASRVLPKKRGFCMLAGLACVQFLEFSGHRPGLMPLSRQDVLFSSAERSFLARFQVDEAMVIPPWTNEIFECRKPAFAEEIEARFYIYTSEKATPINIGYPGRLDTEGVKADCSRVMNEVEHGQIKAHAVYFVEPAFAHYFDVPGISCLPESNVSICVKD